MHKVGSVAVTPRVLAAQGCGRGSSSERARSAVTGALRRKLAALMADFQQLRSRIQDEYRSFGPLLVKLS